MTTTKIFIIYSWDSKEHKIWVNKLADSIEALPDFHVIWDGYDLDSLADKNEFMERGIYEADFIVTVTTENYKLKADGRKGGVGIETYMATARHWDEMLSNKSSNFIVVSREQNSTPRYLAGKFHIDFSDDSTFDLKLSELLKILKKEVRIQRPQKQTSQITIHDFTKTEDIIKRTSAKRTQVVSASAGRNYSGDNKIKYELWEVENPVKSYYITIHEGATISQTLSASFSRLNEHNNKPESIVILKSKKNRNSNYGSYAGVFKSTPSIKEFTYKDYIWDYCIDGSLKEVSPPKAISHYTMQSLRQSDDGGEPFIISSADLHLANILCEDNHTSAHLIIGAGGMGKTSMCLSLTRRLALRENKSAIPILIQAESIKKYTEENNLFNIKIDSIYDFYDLYSKSIGNSNNFDRSTFELAVSCGNFIVIIDGLDELITTFQENFDVGLFLKSISDLHKETGSSSILLTTRNTRFLEGINLDEINISQYELLGFDKEECKSYLKNRFSRFQDPAIYADKVLAQVNKVQLNDSEKRIIPFFIDIIATILEDCLNDEQSTVQELKLEFDKTPYPTNNELTDHIIHSIFKREERRHSNIPATEFVEFISELVAEHGYTWHEEKVKEKLDIYYDSRSDAIFNKLSLNPLISHSESSFCLKYEFLESYFLSLFAIKSICSSSRFSDFYKVLSKIDKDGSEFKDVKKYFSQNKKYIEINSKSIIGELRKQLTLEKPQNSKEIIKRASSIFLKICTESLQLTGDNLTNFIRTRFKKSTDTNGAIILDGVCIIGDYVPLDFTEIIISGGFFKNYTKFLASKFKNSKFIYSTFEGCGNTKIRSSSLKKEMIDSTCEIGDLSNSLVELLDGERKRTALVESEALIFLGSFFRNADLRDNNLAHIRFSNSVNGLLKEKFDKLISRDYISIKVEKTVSTFYEIHINFQESVKKFLNNNYKDRKMKEFLSYISE